MRALRILKEVDLILAEDTRTSSVLLKHYDIHKPLQSHHKFNEHETSAQIARRIQAGESIALISDAGNPGISDPGFMLVREPQLSYPHSLTQACPVTVSCLRDSCLRKRAVRPVSMH